MRDDTQSGNATPVCVLPPSFLMEPELSAYLKCAGRIAAARAALIAAEETWAILAPVLSSRYQLGEGDQIAADGTILRVEEAGDG